MRTATKKDNLIKLKFFEKDSKDFYALVNKVKEIEGRRFDPQTKSWTIPMSLKNIENIAALTFDIEDSIYDWLETENKKSKSIQKEIKQIKFEDEILHEHQVLHTKQLIHSILNNNAALDASDTGTGKTFAALALTKYFKLKPIVLVPLSAIDVWKKVAKLFHIDIYVSNYEQYQRGNNKYLDRKDSFIEKIDRDGNKKTKRVTDFSWNTTNKNIIIFDEAHRCSNSKTLNSNILKASKKTKSKILTLSATIADDPLQMYSLGYTLNIFSDDPEYWRWAFSRGAKKGFFGMKFTATNENLMKIHKDIFPNKGSRMKVSEIEGFPENFIITDPLTMKNAEKIQNVYDEMYDHEMLAITRRIKSRMEIELLKIDTIIEQAKDLIEEGCSVAIFVNFKETIERLSVQLKTKCIVDGSVLGLERQKNIDDFQSDKERIILLNNGAGGMSISLHDLNGKYRRVTLISPPESAKELIQVFGRICRDGTKSKVMQKVIYCANTVEEEIAENLSNKVSNINKINDGDLADPRMLSLFKKEN
jgi:superfamily II DNA or RNA helicase